MGTATCQHNGEKLELSRIAGENLKWCNRFGKQYDSLLKSYTHVLPVILDPRGNANACPPDDWYVNGHNGIFHNSPNLERMRV